MNGGVPPYAWSIDLIPGQTLPVGLSLNTQTGVISGTPTTVGSTHSECASPIRSITLIRRCCALTSSLPFVGTLTATPANDLTPATIDAIAQTLVGSGVAISNVQYTGAAAAIGTFAGAAQIGLNSGIILSSGAVTNINGPNDSPGRTTDNGTRRRRRSQRADPSGTRTAYPNRSTTCDAAVLEFDFVPHGGVVSFQYVFASEDTTNLSTMCSTTCSPS